MELTRSFKEFFDSGRAGGLILVIATAISLVLANSSFQADYIEFWDRGIGGHSMVHWINHGLMTVFFLLIGLELERELYQGELSEFKNALLPIFGAVGGMIVPAGIFLLFNYGTGAQDGAGIPMATDIAFAVGILSLLGNRVPLSLKVFLTALAVMDDLGAIIVIALFYTGTIDIGSLAVALGTMGMLFVLNRLRVHNLIPYLIGGVVMWYFMLSSGVHATITGVLLAFVIPFSDGGEKSPSFILQHLLHIPVALIILPLFALANTGITITAGWIENVLQGSSLGIITGLVVGKPAGIILFSMLGTSIGLCSLPSDLKWTHLLGVGFLAGIGFTMSIFITLLAFEDEALITISKLSILIGSVAAGVIGFFWLRLTLASSSSRGE